MKANFHKLKHPIEEAFYVRKDIRSHFEDKWHFHDMLEMVCIVKGNGERFIGDSIASFRDGEVVVLGCRLPHVWKSKPEYSENEVVLQNCVAIVIQFPETFLGEQFLQLSEAKHIKSLIERAKRGIVFEGESREILAKKMHGVVKSEGMKRLIKFLKTLQVAAMANKFELLASPMFIDAIQHNDDKINKVYGYVMDHFREDINLTEVAQFAGMNKSAFCRYFRKCTKKTFSAFLNEVRIGHVCRLIREKGMPIMEAAYLSGFNSPSYFYKNFKIIKGISPSDYKSAVL
ncbi:MAG: AraC family transcriptional regulator [Saprospiraceae bacterium]|nr:helix-turn-helix domain-containing protein [Lewinella sp.]